MTPTTIKILPDALGRPIWEAGVSLTGAQNTARAYARLIAETIPANLQETRRMFEEALRQCDAFQVIVTERLVAACVALKIIPRADMIVSRDEKMVYRLQYRRLG